MPQAVVPLMVVGAGVGAASSIRQGNMMKKAEQYNASVSEQQAAQLKKQGEIDVINKRKEARSFNAKQKQMYAMSGVELSGSPLQTMADSAAEFEMDILASKYNTAMGISRAESEARYHKYLGRQYAQQGYLNAFSSLLDSGTSIGMYSAGGKARAGR